MEISETDESFLIEIIDIKQLEEVNDEVWNNEDGVADDVGDVLYELIDHSSSDSQTEAKTKDNNPGRKRRSKKNLTKPSAVHKCPECNYTTMKKQLFTEHMKADHNIHTCNNCDFMCVTLSDLRNHSVVHKTIMCDQCSYTCVRRSYLTRHLLTHNGHRPYSCPDCDYTCALSSNLHQHRKSQHINARPFVCTHTGCGATFNYRRNLNLHTFVHTGEKLYHCKLCNYSCTQPYSMKEHQLKHKGDLPYKCNLCKFSTTRPSNLKLHQRKHTGDRPHLCTECGKSFSLLCHLKVHILQHTGEMPFKCTMCGYACKQQRYLKSHVLKEHTSAPPNGKSTRDSKEMRLKPRTKTIDKSENIDFPIHSTETVVTTQAAPANTDADMISVDHKLFIQTIPTKVYNQSLARKDVNEDNAVTPLSVSVSEPKVNQYIPASDQLTPIYVSISEATSNQYIPASDECGQLDLIAEEEATPDPDEGEIEFPPDIIFVPSLDVDVCEYQVRKKYENINNIDANINNVTSRIESSQDNIAETHHIQAHSDGKMSDNKSEFEINSTEHQIETKLRSNSKKNNGDVPDINITTDDNIDMFPSMTDETSDIEILSMDITYDDFPVYIDNEPDSTSECREFAMNEKSLVCSENFEMSSDVSHDSFALNDDVQDPSFGDAEGDGEDGVMADKVKEDNIASMEANERSLTLSRRSRLNNNSHSGVELQCASCEFKCINTCKLKIHHIIEHTNGLPYTCKLCGRIFKHVERLKTHVTKYHEGQELYGCKQCGRNFPTFNEWWDHYDDPDEPDENDKNLQREEKTQMDETQKQVKTQRQEEIQEDKTQKQQKTHQEQKTLNEPTIQKQENPQKKQNTPKEPKAQGSTFMCTFCSRCFNRVGHLESHLMTHTGEKPFKCDQCSYSCTHERYLAVHMRGHSGERPFSCPHCFYRAASTSAMSKHLRRHCDDKPYICQHCGYSCKHSSALTSHVTRRHPSVVT